MLLFQRFLEDQTCEVGASSDVLGRVGLGRVKNGSQKSATLTRCLGWGGLGRVRVRFGSKPGSAGWVAPRSTANISGPPSATFGTRCGCCSALISFS
jgi:hypothetical protein